jgi:DNA (cytosine-5)-methyltransferase 1
MNFLDLFAGIGGFRLGMEQAGHKCIGYVEWDKFARKSYEAIHDMKGEWTAHDITTVTDESIRGIGRVDVITGGFPCQAFSVAGKRGGFNDTRGTLFFEIARFADILRPRYLFLENVTGLLNHEDGNTFETIIGALDEIGYDAEWDCLNSISFLPHNRERVFLIGHLRGTNTRKIFPIRESFEVFGESKRKRTVKGSMVASTITRRYGGVHSGGETYLITNKGVRQFIPRECFRLQGFPDWAFDRAAEVNSDSQLYKQAGNSVTVNVIYEIARRLVE